MRITVFKNYVLAKRDSIILAWPDAMRNPGSTILFGIGSIVLLFYERSYITFHSSPSYAISPDNMFRKPYTNIKQKISRSISTPPKIGFWQALVPLLALFECYKNYLNVKGMSKFLSAPLPPEIQFIQIGWFHIKFGL